MALLLNLEVVLFVTSRAVGPVVIVLDEILGRYHIDFLQVFLALFDP